MQRAKFMDYLLLSFRKLLEKEKTYTHKVAHFVQSLNLEEFDKKQFIKAVESWGYTALAEELAHDVYIFRTYRFSNATVEETECGYRAFKAAHKEYIPFTNFIVKFQKNINFPSTDDIFHEGTMIQGKTQIPFIVSAKNLLKPVEVENVIRRACKDHGSTVYPTITDLSYQNTLINIFRANLADTISVPGVDQLGWSVTKDEFHASAWTSTALDVSKKQKLGHPNIPEFHFYNFRKGYKLKTDPIVFNASVIKMVNLTLAMMYRLYHDLPLKTVYVNNSQRTRHLLKYSFLALGQREEILIPVNRRKEVQMEHLQLPFYGHCKNVGLLKGSELPAFVFTSKEYDLDLSDAFPKATPEEYSCLGNFLQVVLQKFSQLLIQEHGLIDLQTKEEDITVQDLLAEGNSIAADILDLPGWQSLQNLPFLTSAMLNHPIEKIFQYRDGHVEMKYLQANLTMADIKPELSTFVENVERVNKSHVVIPTDTFQTLHKVIFGRICDLETLLPKQPAAENVVDFDEAQG
jgi:hypothetical protein